MLDYTPLYEAKSMPNAKLAVKSSKKIENDLEESKGGPRVEKQKLNFAQDLDRIDGEIV